jgi:integrase
VLRGRGASLDRWRAASHTLPRPQAHLRHTAAREGRPHPKVVSEMLGQANISITLDAYSHAISGMQETAASAMEDVLGNY